MDLKQDFKDILAKFKGAERKMVQIMLEKYLKDYSIESISDINTLKEVIYYEVIQSRLQNKMNMFADDTKSVPTQLVSTMHSNSEQIMKLKNQLGLFNEREKKTQYDVLKHLGRRFRVWLDENQASRTLICPHCGKMVMLKMNTTAWEAQKHPFFKDRVLYNQHLIKLYKDGVIKKEDVAKVLEVSPDYVDWVISKVETSHIEAVETAKQEEEHAVSAQHMDSPSEYGRSDTGGSRESGS